MKEKLSEEEYNALGMRRTTVAEGACKNCGGNVMTKWKYGAPDTACMSCGSEQSTS